MAHTERNRNLAMVFIVSSVAWIAILFIESSQPPAAIMGEVSGLDKVAHFLAFGVLALLVFGASFNLGLGRHLPAFFMPLLIVTVIGVADELYQLSNPSRAFELLDLVADISGAVICLYVYKLILKSRLMRRFNLSK
ncbi:VanZ family protein [Methylomonas sp. OY6]|uniref:VanZ family protein n=1 Tax=Methylomonas defluvii TaxID=3045149 RepID=A0ABU4UCH9_9GAMM|nr:VanZ family protein [Methylomonas sp. OY6]MDX8127143.1 VanZ family protein [Methylomonas sp. OY6]